MAVFYVPVQPSAGGSIWAFGVSVLAARATLPVQEAGIMA